MGGTAPAGTRARSPKPRNANAPPRGSRKQATENGEVRFTNPDRVYWADVGVTKQDLADYYCAVWEYMAPHVVGRPIHFPDALRFRPPRRAVAGHLSRL